MVKGMHPRLETLYLSTTDLLGPTLAARLDVLRPSYRYSWGGPLNGQEQRRAVVRRLARSIEFDIVIETGTYRGTSTEFFAAIFGCPVHSVEANPRYFAYCQWRLAGHP